MLAKLCRTEGVGRARKLQRCKLNSARKRQRTIPEVGMSSLARSRWFCNCVRLQGDNGFPLVSVSNADHIYLERLYFFKNALRLFVRLKHLENCF